MRMNLSIPGILMALCAAGAGFAAGESPTLRVATYNIHHGEGSDGVVDLDRIAAILKGMDPDIVCLQEVDRNQPRTGRADMPALMAEKLGMAVAYGVNYRFSGGEYGVATLTRLPLLGERNTPLANPDNKEPRGCLTVTVRWEGREVEVHNTHLGLSGPERSAQVTDLLGIIRKEVPTLLLGDLNEGPDAPGVARLREVLPDTWQGGAEAGTLPGGKRPRRIDFILASPHFSTVESVIHDTPETRTASDHFPCHAVLQWRGDAAEREGGGVFEGRHFQGEGNLEHLRLLETAARMFRPDPEYQNISMLYTPVWNGFVEGPTWGAWWIQNSYGPSYCAVPFLEEPLTTFLQNAQDLWFAHIGDGERRGEKGWVGPDGCLCDAAAPSLVYYKQGDGRIDIHDWGMEFTAAGVVMQAELLLAGRDPAAIARYLPLLERNANFIETRRDPANNLFLAGPAGNLLAPSYAGWKQPDGTYGMAYLTGLSVTYIAALDRLIELEKLAGHPEKAALHTERRDLAKQGLPLLTTEEGYFIKSLDPDGTRHGVYGAEKHGYFEAVCNHDAMAFNVADDAQARKIYDKIASIPGLRPHGVIITNYPGLDDTYADTKDWLWSFGTWVNGGHWTTAEARMMLGYHRVGAYEDARRAMRHILGLARQFRMDNPLTEFGAAVYQPKEPINCVYDNWGAPAALIRGLFEYLYRAEGLELRPHIPPDITRLDQRFPIRFGTKRLYLSTTGSGPVTGVEVNGAAWKNFDATSVFLPHSETPDTARVQVLLGGAAARGLPEAAAPELPTVESLPDAYAPFRELHARLRDAGLGDCYEARHAGLIVEYFAAIEARNKMLAEGTLAKLPEASQAAADKSYTDTVEKLAEGLRGVLKARGDSENPRDREIAAMWRAVSGGN